MAQKKQNKKTKRMKRQAKAVARKKNKSNRQSAEPGEITFIDPPDGIKMSAVILKLADPLIEKYGDNDHRIKAIISLTIIEWNKLMLPEDQQENIDDIKLDNLVSIGSNAEHVGSLLYIGELIADRKKKYFPDLKKAILSYDLSVSNGNISLNVSSAPI